MHPLVYYTILELERDERLRNIERERQIRERLQRTQIERSGLRVGHARVAPVRPSLLARLGVALRGRPANAGRIAGSAEASPGGAATMIGCRA